MDDEPTDEGPPLSGGEGEEEPAEPPPFLGNVGGDAANSEAPSPPLNPLTPDELRFVSSVPDFVRLSILLILRRNLPDFVQRNKSDAELFARGPDMIRDGFLDHCIGHYTSLLETLQASSDAVSQIMTLAPLSPGQFPSPELLAFLRPQLPLSQPAAELSLRPKLPEPGTFSGPSSGQTKLQILLAICSWVDSCVASGALSALPEPQLLIWAVTFLRGAAATWWAGEKFSTSISTFSELRKGLVTRFVGTQPFELLCADLEGRNLSSFPKFASFKSWFGQTVSAMRAFAESGRMWQDTVLIDKLLLCLEGTLYHSGVVVDPSTRQRPTSLADALRLLDERHAILLMRRESQDDKGKVSAPKPQPAPKRPATGDASTSGASGKTAAPPGKRAKTARLPLQEYIRSICPQLRAADVERHMANGKAGKPLSCLLCQGAHFVTKCPRFEAAKGKAKKRPEN